MNNRERPIIIFEDDGGWLTQLSGLLTDFGYVVYRTANSMEGAIDVLGQVSELKNPLFFLDANLQPYDESGKDGKSLAEMIRAANLGATIIGLSDSKQPYVDHEMGKQGIRKLPTILKKIEVG